MRLNNRRMLIALCVICGAVSCYKPQTGNTSDPFAFTVTGIGDLSIPSNDFVAFAASANLVSGNAPAEPVTVTFTGMPANVSAQNSDITFRLNYQVADTFYAHNAVQGTYPMQVVFTSSAGVQTYHFNLTVTPPVNRVAVLAGYYYPSNSCSNNVYISCTIDSIPGTPGGIRLIDRVSAGGTSPSTYDTCYGTVDCCTNTFTIPAQSVHATTIQGYGSFSIASYPNTPVVVVHKTITTSTGTSNCIVTLSQQ